MLPREYACYDALGLGQLISSGEITRGELIDVCQTIIEGLDGKLNAVVSRHFDQARAWADDYASCAPFFGTPFGAKEEGAYYSGIASGASSKLITPYDPKYDTNFVTRYKKAGLNLVAKLNMPELAGSVTTESSVNGVCRNPWNTARSSGGSSGGSAAAVAAGYFPAAYGNDGAGSIRIPASCCGVFGFKPSRGRVPKGPVLIDEWGGNVVDHVLTRSVRDSAAILDIASGVDIGAPYDAPYSPHSFLSACKGPDRPLRIGFSTSAPNGVPVHRDCVEATNKAARLCAELGHEVVEAQPEIDGEQLFRHLFDLMSAHVAKEARYLFKEAGFTPSPEFLEPTNYMLFERGMRLSAPDYLDAVFALGQISRRSAKFFEQFDVWLCPTLAMPPVRHHQISQAMGKVEDFWQGWASFIPFTPLANIAGQPAMSVPLFLSDDGLPIGAHFQARIGNDALLLGLAAQLETAHPWAGRVPPVSAWNLAHG